MITSGESAAKADTGRLIVFILALFSMFAILQFICNDKLVESDNHDITAGSHIDQSHPFDKVHFGDDRPHFQMPLSSRAFWRPVEYFDLPAKLNLDPNSPLLRVAAFLILSCIALLTDLVFFSLPVWRRWLLITRSGALFLLLPFQGAVVWIARALLAVPCTPAALAIFLFASVKFLLIIRYGFALSSRLESRGSKQFQNIVSGSGLVLYCVVSAQLLPSLLLDYGFKQPLAWIIIAAPVLVHTAGLFSAPFYPRGAFFVSVSQFCIYFILKPFCPALPPVFFFLMISLLPWMIGIVVNTAGLLRRKAVFPTVLIVTASCSLLFSVETGIRSIWYLDRLFNYTPKAEYFNWDIEMHTDLLDNHADMEFITLKSCWYSDTPGEKLSVYKTPGVCRIVCLGSSTTWGVGASDESKGAYPVKLEEYLNKKIESPVEVINCGIVGAPLFMLEVFLEEVILPYLDPDLVILYFGINGDVWTVRQYYDRLKEKRAEAPFAESNEEIWAAMQLRIVTPLTVRAYMSLSKIRIATMIFTGLDLLHGESTGPADPRMTGEALYKSPRSMVRLCREHGKKILLIPEYIRGDCDIKKTRHPYYGIFSEIASGSQGDDVYYMRVDEFFSPETEEAFLIFENADTDVHMNAGGYSFLAEKIAAFLLKNGIINPLPVAQEIREPGLASERG